MLCCSVLCSVVFCCFAGLLCCNALCCVVVLLCSVWLLYPVHQVKSALITRCTLVCVMLCNSNDYHTAVPHQHADFSCVCVCVNLSYL